MRRWIVLTQCLTLLGAAALLAHPTRGVAQTPAPNVELYEGADPETSGIRLSGWGSGRAIVDRAVKAVGDTSIKIETNGFYAGGRIVFENPRSITDQKADPHGYLEFTIKFQPGTKREDRPSTLFPGLGGSGGFPGRSAAGDVGAGGGFPGIPFPGGITPGLGSTSESEDITPDTTRMKVVLISDQASYVASNFPVQLNPAREEGWYIVAIPWVAFRGMDTASAVRVRELRIFGDNKDTFWIGQIRTTTDDEPIVVEPLDDEEVLVDDPVEFTATASGGISPLQFVWDFDLSDGLQEDAIGRRVTHTFKKPSREVAGSPGEVQPYVVTLTVRDLSGAKRPVRRTANVIVNP